jgi:hypothetical protein
MICVCWLPCHTSAIEFTNEGRSISETALGSAKDQDGVGAGDAVVFDGADGAAGAGCVTVVVFEGELNCDRVPNQFHCVKPKNNKMSTSSARIAAAAPAPGPDVVDSVSTTSEPAGLQ